MEQQLNGWYDKPVNTEDELVDRVAQLANGCKFSWSDQDKAEMRDIAKIIIRNVLGFVATATVN